MGQRTTRKIKSSQKRVSEKGKSLSQYTKRLKMLELDSKPVSEVYLGYIINVIGT